MPSDRLICHPGVGKLQEQFLKAGLESRILHVPDSLEGGPGQRRGELPITPPSPGGHRDEALWDALPIQSFGKLIGKHGYAVTFFRVISAQPVGTIFPSPRLETALPWGGKATGFGLSAKLPHQRHRPGQLDLLVAPIIRPLGGQQRAPRQVPDVSDENVFDRSVETMTRLDLERNRFGRSLPCREGCRPLFQVIGRDGFRNPIQSHGYLDAPIGMTPHLYWMIALEDYLVAIIFSNLKDGVVGICILRILRLEGGNLLKVVFLEDQFPIDHGKGSRRQASLVVEVGILRHGVVGILHPYGGRHFFGSDYHGIPNNHGLGGVPFPVFAA